MIVRVLILGLCLVPLANSLECYSCPIFDPDCVNLQHPGTSNFVQCDPSVTSCITVHHLDGGAERDCLMDEVSQCAPPLLCEKCDSDLCNIHQVNPIICITCDSKTDENCTNNVDPAWESLCPYAIDELNGCYLYHSADNHVRRGCVINLDPVDLEVCMAGVDCKICLGKNCNIKGICG